MSKLKETLGALPIARTMLVVFACILILVVPQLNIQEYALSSVTSKLVCFLYGCLGLLGLLTLILVCSKKISYSFTKIDITLFTLILYIILNRYFIQSYYGFSVRYIELLGLAFFYIVLRAISIKNYVWLVVAIIISGTIQAVHGKLQLLGFDNSSHSEFIMTGSFFNPGPYAGFLASVWTLALGMYLFRDAIITQDQFSKMSNLLFRNQIIKYIFKYIPLLALFSIGIVLPATQSRASWIALLVGSGVLIELKFHFLKKLSKNVTIRFQKAVLVLLFLGILSTGLLGLYYYKKPSSDGRMFIWKVTTEMVAETPFFGVGFDQFKAYYMNYQANFFSKNIEAPESLVADNVNYAFNEALQFAAENGFVGLLLLLVIVNVLLQTKVNEKHKTEAHVAKVGLLTIAIFAGFSYPMQILPIKFVLVVLVAILSNSGASRFEFKIGDNQMKIWTYKISFILLACLTIYATLSYTKNLSKAYVAWNNASISNRYSDYTDAIQEFEIAYPVLKRDGDFLMKYGKTLFLAGEPHKAIEILEKAKLYQNNTVIATSLGDSYKKVHEYKKAEAHYQQAINMAPGKFYGNYLLAKLYDDSGQQEKAVAIAKKLMNKEVKIASTAIKEIQGEMEELLLKYENPDSLKKY